MINNIKVITACREFQLQEIDGIVIKDNNVNVHAGNEVHALFTSVANNGSIKPMPASSFRNIVIDHVIPMSNILIENDSRLVFLKQLTNLMIKINGKPLTSRKEIVKIGNYLLKENKLNGSHVQNINGELNIIINATELQLMCRRENALKASK